MRGTAWPGPARPGRAWPGGARQGKAGLGEARLGEARIFLYIAQGEKMNTSDEINEIATALSKAQAQMTGAKKGAKNPFFKSNYSDLASVIEAISKPFADNGLCFIQAPELHENKVTVTTRIMHASGQWIESTITLPPTKNDAQAIGSCVTYGKRYSIQAMAGVPSIDDDGQSAVMHGINNPTVSIDGYVKQIKETKNMTELMKVWGNIPPEVQKPLMAYKDAMKTTHKGNIAT